MFFVPSLNSLMASLEYKLNSHGDKEQPCLSPLSEYILVRAPPDSLPLSFGLGMKR